MGQDSWRRDQNLPDFQSHFHGNIIARSSVLDQCKSRGANLSKQKKYSLMRGMRKKQKSARAKVDSLIHISESSAMQKFLGLSNVDECAPKEAQAENRVTG